MTTTNILTDHTGAGNQPTRVGEDPNPRNGHRPVVTHSPSAAAGLTPDQATLAALPSRLPLDRDQTRPTPAKDGAATIDAALGLDELNSQLALAADMLDDLEQIRTANENRLRTLTKLPTETDKDGHARGFGLALGHPTVARAAAIVRAMKCDSELVTLLTGTKERRHANCCLEHAAEKNLTAILKTHPLHPWVKQQKGVGDKQIARLLAVLGDPYIRPPMTRGDHTEPVRPRTVSELWAYCGYVPFQRRRKGQRSNWSATAKMRAYNVAESTKKQLIKPCCTITGTKGEYITSVHVDGECRCSPWRVLYDKSRTKYKDAVHPRECAQCGPAGGPAAPGTPRSANHQDAMATRIVAKEILKHLWQEAKRLHEHPPAASLPPMPRKPAPLGETNSGGAE